MSFASLVFLYFFLPIVLVGYYVLPRRWRNPFLLAANLVFYGWGEPWFLPVILLTACGNWLIGLKIERSAAKRRRLWLAAALLLDLGLLIAFKYTGFVLRSIGLGHLLASPIPLPLGISFYIFQVVSYVVDVYRRTVPAETSPVRFATYMTFFPQLIAVGSPRPRKDKPASATMMPALVRAVLMISRWDTPGRIWRNMMWLRLAPASSAALT